MVKSICFRNENCWISEEYCFFPTDFKLEHPIKMESPLEKADCTLTPTLGILRPIPEGFRKSSTLIESEVQNTPSFPSASAELILQEIK